MRRPLAEPAHQGLTVVEVIVALTLITVGVLGFAATSALALRSTTTAARQHDAVQRASLRLALLAATGCEQARSGEATVGPRGIREQWIVGARENGARAISLVVEWSAPGGQRTLHIGSALIC